MLKYFSAFVLISLVVFLVITFVSDKRLNNLLSLENRLVATTYKSIVKSYKINADILFDNVINKKDVLSIFSLAQTRPDEARTQLYKKLKPMYETMGEFKLRQLHFHLKNNDSFLRFHRPNKYGDNLSDIRDTVRYVNEHHLYISGFEEGRIFNGYRFVFPLFYLDEHLGSVETSISMQSINGSLEELLDAKAEFIIDEKIVKEKVFKKEQSNYIKYDGLSGYLIDKNLINSQLIKSVLKNDKSLRSFLQNHKNDGQIVSTFTDFNSISYIVSMINIPKVLTDDLAANIVVVKEHKELTYIKMQRIFVIFMFILLAGIILFYNYKSKVQTLELLDSELKFKKLFDIQKSIIIVTDGKKLKMANEAMCDFFGVNYLTFFKKHHNDICDRFIESENYFNITKVPPHLTWVEAIEVLKGDERIVVMHNLESMPRAFNVSVSRYSDKEYIVLFTDISETIVEKMDLSKKIIRDSLTGVYNRVFFEFNINKILNNLKGNEKLGVTMIDIDYFKKVNDTYGHDIGDKILIEFSSLIEANIREDDYIIRWGGEEFIILTTTLSEETLHKTLEHIREKIQAYPFTSVGEVTCSFGATLHNDKEYIDRTIIRADKALYEAKEKGRNRVVIH